MASHGGSVIASYFSDSYGNVVMLDDGNGTTTLYAHMISCAVSVGDGIEAGTTIGYVGSTGLSTGNHLHFEVRVDGILINAFNGCACTWKCDDAKNLQFQASGFAI